MILTHPLYFINETILSSTNQIGDIEPNGDSHHYNMRNKNNMKVIQNNLQFFYEKPQ